MTTRSTHTLARSLVLVALVALATHAAGCLGGCGDPGKGVGEACQVDDDCESNYCEAQQNGAKRCAQRPTSVAAGPGGW
jgi:hypothetical protein